MGFSINTVGISAESVGLNTESVVRVTERVYLPDCSGTVDLDHPTVEIKR